MSLFELRCEPIPSRPHVVALRGHEAISTLYSFEAFFTLHNDSAADVDLDGLIGARASLLVKAAGDGAEQRYHGVLSEVEILHSFNEQSLLRATLVPALYKLALSRHGRVFTELSFPDILKEIIDGYGLDHELELQLSGEHPVEPHVCQYRESDYHFLARWMQREGIYFYFDHSGDTAEKLLIVDDLGVHQASLGAAVRYRPVAAGDVSSGESLRSLRPLHLMQAASTLFRDYDETHPQLDVSGDSDVSPTGAGAVVHHESRFLTPSEGKRLAELHAQALRAQASSLAGRGTVFGLRPGFTFELDEHPRAELNRDYLVTSIRHQGAQALDDGEIRELIGGNLRNGYEVEIHAIAADLQYRHRCEVPWPRIHGYELAVVDGPADSEYAQLDDHGRYLVRLMFDERDNDDGGASTRIRMMQPHTGNPEGWHFPLRKGTEVVIAFLGGDPDRPLVAGSVPNAHNPSLVTSGNNTQNVLQTGGLTRIEIEDEKDKQFIWMSTPPAETQMNLGHPTHLSHNITIKSQKDCLYDIGSNQLIEVGGALDEQVTGDVTETYKSDQTSTIDGPQTTTVANAVKETYLGSQTTTVNGAVREELFQNGHKSLVLGARSETYATSQLQQVFGKTEETWIGGWTRSVGATSEYHGDTLTEIVAGNVVELCPSGVTETFGDTTAVWASLLWLGPSVTLTVPQWTFTCPSLLDVSATWNWTNSTEDMAKWTDTGSKGLKIGVTISAREATLAKYEAVGCAIGVKGPAFERGLIKIGGIAFVLCLAGFEKVG